MATTAPVLNPQFQIFQDGIQNDSVEIIGSIPTVSAAATAIGLSNRLVKISVSGTTSTAMTLAAGSEGQLITLVMTGIGTGSSDAVVTAPLFGDNTTMTFNAVGDSVTLVCLSGEWYVVSNNSVAIA